MRIFAKKKIWKFPETSGEFLGILNKHATGDLYIYVFFFQPRVSIATT